MTGDITPGLLVLHGNRTETLAEAVFEWLRSTPLRPLEEETFLVQSNGVAEWLKMTLAAHTGISAATRVELPARFLWRAYRQVLGRDAESTTRSRVRESAVEPAERDDDGLLERETRREDLAEDLSERARRHVSAALLE